MKTLISKSQRSLVYYHKADDGTDEVWKIYQDAAREETLLQKELLLSQKITSPRFRKALGTGIYHNQSTLILEYAQGISVRDFTRSQAVSLDTFFPICFGLLELLQDLQHDKLLHNRLNPDNIIIDPSNLQLHLIDFSKAETLPYLPISLPASQYDPLELPYFSPELTGLLKRKADHRSDMYSAGILLYEILAGRVPFQNSNNRELLYEILAQPAQPVRWVNTATPKILDEILLKLISKSPEDRYQSVHGLRKDFELFRDSTRQPSLQVGFAPAQHDISADLRPSEKLYGRERELDVLSKQLQAAIAGGKVIVCITGEAGSGKSALATKLRKEVILQRGVFLYGEFDLATQGKPFHALELALRELASIILCEDQYRLEQWKKSLTIAVGEIGKVLTDLIPEFKWILGDLPEVPVLNGAESQSRLQYLFQKLIESLADEQHPLIIFLDDFQWADQSSRNLINALIQYPRTRHFMLVIASREDPALPQTILPNNADITFLRLKDLDRYEIRDVLNDSIPTGDNMLLADIVFNKTKGNPFYIQQFLHAFWRSNAFRFDVVSRRWKYDAKQLESSEATENVIDFILSRLNDLTPACIQLLEYASCVGKEFSAEVLAVLLQVPEPACQDLINEAVHHGFVEVAGNGNCGFAHDRIHESAYTRVGEKKRKQLHAAIGLQWLKTYGYSPNTETLYEIARHLFLGLEYLPGAERMNYILLNYKCGDRAKEKAAFSAAFGYFSRAIHLLEPDDWSAHYDLVLNLFIGGSESAAIIGERGVAEAWAQLVVDHADTLQTKFRGFEVKLNILNENLEMLQAVELLLSLLNELGFKIKRKPTNIDLLIELVKTKKVLWNRRINDLEHLQPMSNEAALLFMRLSAKCTTSIFSAAPELLPLIVFKQVQLSVRYGNSPYSPVGYAAYGFALSSILGQLDRGFQFGELALRIASSNNSAEVLAKVGAMFYGFLSYWKNDIRKSIPALKKTYTIGRETGDLLYASFAATFHSCLLFFTGEKLEIVQQLMEEDSSLIREMKQDLVYMVSENQRQMVQHLTMPSGRPLSITGAEPTEVQFVQKLLDKKDAATLFDFYVYKVILCYLLEDPITTFNFAEKAFEHEDETSSQQMSYPYFMLFTALAAAGAYLSSPAKKYIRRIKVAKNKLKRIAEHAPDNFKAMHELTTGAYYSVKGQRELALKYYSQGVESARANKFIHLQAIGYDLLGNHYVRNEAWAHADMVLKKAHATYASWGAMAKCFKLEVQYPELFVDLHANRPAFAKNSVIHNNILSEASNTVSYVSDVDQLLRNLLQMIIDFCEVNSLQLLFRHKDDTFQVKAWVRGTEFIINNSKNLSRQVPPFPLSVINFINRSKQFLLSENPENDQRFYMDPYFRENNVSAFIGYPIVRNDKLLAIVYIENIEPATGFRHDIAGMLRSISMLIGISVENALLIEDHERISLLEKDFNNNLLAISHSAEENERKRIAAELHDDIGALLSTTKLYLTHQQNDSSPTQKKAQAILDQAIQNLRQISHQLSPTSLEQFGLVTGIKGMIHDIQQTGAIKVALDSNLSERLTQSQELQLYRIFQELFNNTLKYSKATHVMVRIEKKSNRLECEFTDNGIGFDIDAVTNSHQPGKGIGLQNITSRARTINGKLYLHSAPGKGVSMKLEVKL